MLSLNCFEILAVLQLNVSKFTVSISYANMYTEIRCKVLMNEKNKLINQSVILHPLQIYSYLEARLKELVNSFLHYSYLNPNTNEVKQLRIFYFKSDDKYSKTQHKHQIQIWTSYYLPEFISNCLLINYNSTASVIKHRY